MDECQPLPPATEVTSAVASASKAAGTPVAGIWHAPKGRSFTASTKGRADNAHHVM
jgi:hypothetical protein